MTYEDEAEVEEKPVPIEFNPEEVNALLDVILKTKDMPNFASLGHAAMTNLAIIANELQKVMLEKLEEAKKKEAEKAVAKAAAAKKAEGQWTPPPSEGVERRI